MSEAPENETIHRTLETDEPEPATQIAEIVADIESVGHEELTPTYEQIDHVLDEIFSNPPDPNAQIQVTFSYEGYRITVEQDGSAQFVKVD